MLLEHVLKPAAVPVDYTVQLIVEVALAVKLIYAFFQFYGLCDIIFFHRNSSLNYTYDIILPMKILSIICCYSLPFTNSEKEMPNILLQVAAKWDGESNPARMEASVIFPYFWKWIYPLRILSMAR